MTGKSKHDERQQRQRTGNLGQKDAQQQQHTDSELQQMGERTRDAREGKEKRESK